MKPWVSYIKPRLSLFATTIKLFMLNQAFIYQFLMTKSNKVITLERKICKTGFLINHKKGSRRSGYFCL